LEDWTLQQSGPDVPRWRDIRDVTAESFRERTGLQTVDIISGGFPCQPFSVAGKQKGKGDDRYLWPEMLRVITELKPRWVLGENVPGILRIAADDVCKDLEREGYDIGIFDYEAAAVGAPHRRERIFFVANARHTESSRRDETKKSRPWPSCGKSASCGIHVANTNDTGNRTSRDRVDREWPEDNKRWEEQPQFRACGCGAYMANATQSELQKPSENGNENATGLAGLANGGWWAVEPGMGRMAYGIPNRVDRLKCLGNAVVPYQAYPIYLAISEIEMIEEENTCI